MANTGTKTKTTAAERRRAAREESRRRQDYILNALDNKLTEEARGVLTAALDNIASDYSYAVNYAIEEAEREMLDSLEAPAKTWGWVLVDTAGEDATIELDHPVANCVSDDSKYAHMHDESYDADQEFSALDTHVEAANLRHPDKKEQE